MVSQAQLAMLKCAPLPVAFQQDLMSRGGHTASMLAQNPFVDDTVIASGYTRTISANFAQSLVGRELTAHSAARVVTARERRVTPLQTLISRNANSQPVMDTISDLALPSQVMPSYLRSAASPHVKMQVADRADSSDLYTWAVGNNDMSDQDTATLIDKSLAGGSIGVLTLPPVVNMLRNRPGMHEWAAMHTNAAIVAALAVLAPRSQMRATMMRSLGQMDPSDGSFRDLLNALADDPQISAAEYQLLEEWHEAWRERQTRSGSSELVPFRGFGRDFEKMSSDQLEQVVTTPLEISTYYANRHSYAFSRRLLHLLTLTRRRRLNRRVRVAATSRLLADMNMPGPDYDQKVVAELTVTLTGHNLGPEDRTTPMGSPRTVTKPDPDPEAGAKLRTDSLRPSSRYGGGYIDDTRRRAAENAGAYLRSELGDELLRWQMAFMMLEDDSGDMGMRDVVDAAMAASS